MKRRLNTKSQCVQNVETKTDILHARLNFLKNENNDIDNKTKSGNKMKLLNNLKLTDITGKIINTKDVKIKIIQKILNKKSIPKCQDK